MLEFSSCLQQPCKMRVWLGIELALHTSISQNLGYSKGISSPEMVINTHRYRSAQIALFDTAGREAVALKRQVRTKKEKKGKKKNKNASSECTAAWR